MKNQSRRGFMKSVGALSSASVVSPLLGSLLAMKDAAAQSAGDYKALVCVYLAGGNDAHNTLVYNDSDGTVPNTHRFGYQTKRPDIALSSEKMEALNLPAGAVPMALNKKLSYLAGLFNAPQNPRLAIVANMGPLLDGTTNTRDYLDQQTAVWPSKLFSHNDQTSIWLTGDLEGNRPGWGGALISENDAAWVSEDGSKYQTISMNQLSAFCSNGEVLGFAANSATGIKKPGSLDGYEGLNLLGNYANNHNDDTYLVPLLNGEVGATGTGHFLEVDYIAKMSNAYSQWKYLKQEPSPSTPRLNLSNNDALRQLAPNNELWHQLAMALQFITAQSAIGVGRQVFFVQMGAFDTHSGQASGDSNHDRLLEKLNEALQLFDTNLGAVSGLRDKVTTFTASEFGRKLIQNGDGTDHGWGGHHFVMGGAQVAGGKIYGSVPSLQIPSADASLTDPHLLSDGTMIPTIAVEHVGWELAKWFGVPNTDTAKEAIFPNYFDPAENVAFMKP